MADFIYYDQPGVFYDAPDQVYLEGSPPPVPSRMKKIKLSTSKMKPEQAAGFAHQVVGSMTGNANYPTPDPTLASLTAAAEAVEDKQLAIANLESDLQVAKDDLSTLDAALKVEIRKMADHVQDKSDGDVAKIHSAGFVVIGDPVPRGPLSQVGNVRLQSADVEGQLTVRFGSVPGAAAYMIEFGESGDGPWTQATVTTRTSFALTGLTPGRKYWVRVRAVGGSTGFGGWSDPACRMAA